MLRDPHPLPTRMSRDDWLVAFMRRLIFDRPDYSRTLARKVAIAEYVMHSQGDPCEAARAWVGRNRVG